MTNFIRNHSHGGVPGENLPFDISNRYKLITASCTLYNSSPDNVVAQ
ncbi:cytochrome c oxidase subunit VIIc [Danaus plexippus plexippus]|uniref:Cytochrome c oxidase subunit VIIc n=1 Tax=Danaus plexippus plexippus TaxID=278856 RepID=A0A212EPJ7_DANPL|nr:cytochrome c oxidase subunit VIIc [Danaus plexippus plexippus]